MHDGYFGGAYLHRHRREQNRDELKSNLGFGARSMTTALKMPGCQILNLLPREPFWVQAHDYNTNDPLASDWYEPQTWNVVSKVVHKSRLLTLISSPVSDMLKPAYAFGGIPLIQKAKPYVDNFLQMRQNAQDYTRSLSMYVLASNMPSLLGGNANDPSILNRAEAAARFRSAKNMMLIDKETEEVSSVSLAVAGIDRLVAQAQEHISAVSRIPLVKWMGLSPSGLNASSEGEIRVYYDLIHAEQEFLLRTPIQYVLDLIQIELFGDVDSDITFEFVELYEMTELEKAQKRQVDELGRTLRSCRSARSPLRRFASGSQTILTRRTSISTSASCRSSRSSRIRTLRLRATAVMTRGSR